MATQEDRFDALDEDSLYRYLTDTAAKRCEYLEIEERADGWVAEIWREGGKVNLLTHPWAVSPAWEGWAESAE
jgi:hypothetical protein